VEHGATARGEKMSLIGKLMFTGLLFILIALLAAGMWAEVNGIRGIVCASSPVSTVKKLGLIVALLVGIGMLATMIAFYFNGILMTWSVK
jgi:hypothetical protein